MQRFLVALALVCAIATGARGDDTAQKPSYRAVIDRVDLEPSSITGFRLRVYLSALALEGHLLDLTDPRSIKLYLGSSELKAPYALGSYDATSSDTAIVIAVQASIDFSEVLPMIVDSLDRDLLPALGDRTQITVMSYGENTGTGKLAAIKAVRGKIQLAPDGSAGDPALLDTVDRGLLLLRKAATDPPGRPIRKLIVVIGDGRDRSGDKDRVTRTGNRAAKEGVRIHTLAFSGADVRRPMLALGELSKRSMGTFRWVRKPTADSWSAAIKQLKDEIAKQYVLTYFVTGEEDVAGKRLHIVTVGRTETTSNEVKVPAAPSCNGTACDTGYCADDRCVVPRSGGGRGILHWILVIGGFALGAVVLLGVIGYLMSRRQQVAPPPAFVPGITGAPVAPVVPPPKAKRSKKPPAAAPVLQPGMLPNGHPIPVLLVMTGPLTGQRFFLRNGFLVGKQPGCDLLIEDGFTSSQHAQIGMDAAGACKIYDRGSTNGTYINGVRITEANLEHGATIRIGSTELRYLTQ